MPDELPRDVRDLRAKIALDSLTRSFRHTFSEEPPDYIINDPRQIRRAQDEWSEAYQHQTVLLAYAAQSALRYLDEQGHEAAIMGFTSSVITQTALNEFMHANLYLEELVAGTLRDAEAFRNLLTLFVQLGGLDS